MHILFVSSEVEPFAKTGGLADVCGALPRSIARQGEQVSIITPLYRQTRRHLRKPVLIAEMAVSAGQRTVNMQILRKRGRSKVAVYFVRCDELFERDGIYEDTEGAFPDNHLRFIFFCKAVTGFCRTPDMRPDIVHLHDWQTALIAAYIRQAADEPALKRCATVMTIHNLAYQGVFPAEVFKLTNLPDSFWHFSQLEFWGRVNFLKAGIANADLITTVSPTYAREITEPELGCGLEAALSARTKDLHGILNGADYDAWDPARDKLIEAVYDTKNPVGKKACKQALIRRFNLDPVIENQPLSGCISRLVDQKGFDLITEIFDDIIQQSGGFVLLGTGEQKHHDFFTRMAKRYPDRVGVLLDYDNTVAHQIEAGCDIFLMPSRYEPCGLTQIYSLRYGTVPVVRATGGLADTITDCDLDPERGNGFVFEGYRSRALLEAFTRALACYQRPARWQALMQRCMACDFSWDASAKAYLETYRKAQKKKTSPET